IMCSHKHGVRSGRIVDEQAQRHADGGGDDMEGGILMPSSKIEGNGEDNVEGAQEFGPCKSCVLDDNRTAGKERGDQPDAPIAEFGQLSGEQNAGEENQQIQEAEYDLEIVEFLSQPMS